ncbi:MAG TPA: glycosyltransferase [Bryobacteraceae bacterium]|jgi:glycosyltransferase involved in cell wall biosynthesis
MVNMTVLMSVYNTPARMLSRSIESILIQSLSSFEFLILDDGSTEAPTRRHLAEAAARDSRIRLFFEPHRGLTPTLNRGLALAKGELIARQDADDWSEPQRLARQAAYLEKHPETGLLGSAAYTHQQDETPLWTVRLPETQGQIRAALDRGNPFIHGSVMFRAEAARAAGGYREALRCSQDYDFFWRLTEAAGAANLADPLYHYRYSAESVSAGRAGEQASAQRSARLLAQARRRGESEDAIVARISRESPSKPEDTFRALLKQADHVMLAGNYGRAGRAYWDLLRSRPASLLAWAKLARLALFSVAPKARPLCFR